MSLLSFSFVIVYIVHKILGLLKIDPNYLKGSNLEYLFKEHRV